MDNLEVLFATRVGAKKLRPSARTGARLKQQIQLAAVVGASIASCRLPFCKKLTLEESKIGIVETTLNPGINKEVI